MPRTASFEIVKPPTLNVTSYSLSLSLPGKHAAEAWSVQDGTTRTCGYLARRDSEGRWSAHTDNGIFLGAVGTITDALYLVAAYYAQ